MLCFKFHYLLLYDFNYYTLVILFLIGHNLCKFIKKKKIMCHWFHCWDKKSNFILYSIRLYMQSFIIRIPSKMYLRYIVEVQIMISENQTRHGFRKNITFGFLDVQCDMLF